MKPGRWIDLGRRDYHEVWRLQLRLVERRQAGELGDLLLLCEHPDVITLGRRRGALDNIVAEPAMPVVEIERGGDVTYHGPGQLVGYPIVQLDGEERDLHAYLRALEEGLIGACGELGVAAGRNPGWTGVWTGARKLASLGIAVRRWVTMHGFALNVSTDLARFEAIKPCGLDAQLMTSLERELGRPVALAAVVPLVARHVGAALGRAFEPAPPSAIGE